MTMGAAMHRLFFYLDGIGVEGLWDIAEGNFAPCGFRIANLREFTDAAKADYNLDVDQTNPWSAVHQWITKVWTDGRLDSIAFDEYKQEIDIAAWAKESEARAQDEEDGS